MSEMLFWERRIGLRVVPTEYTEWQRPLFWRTFHHDGKISPGWWEVGDARPPSFTISTIAYRVVVYAPAERADTLHLFLLYPYMFSVMVSDDAECYSRGLAQHGGPPDWLEESDPAGLILYVMYCPFCPP
jgi:hypothetical protein